MELTDITKRRLGVYFDDESKAHINIWAPEKKAITLYVNNKKCKDQPTFIDGYWQLVTTALKAGDTYGFSVDENKVMPDPGSLWQQEGVHQSSTAYDTSAYTWSDGNWENHALENYIFYELHTGTFTASGNFEGIEQRLDYLAALGITAIEIMPVAQFPGERNWGYDGVFPFAVQHSYGGPAALQQLVNAAHAKGIAVVLDVVYNHFGPEGNYLAAYGPYFTDKYKTPWGDALNFDDAWCDGVRRFFIENVLMWFRDFHIDALRLDAVHAIKDFSALHILQEIQQHVAALMQATGKTHHLIVELDLNDNRYINPPASGGYGMDAQWVDEFHHALRVTAGGDTTGYYSDFNGIEHLAKSYMDAYVYDGQFSAHRKRKFGAIAANNEGKQFIVFAQNHDQVGNRMLGERATNLFSYDMLKLLAGVVMVAPYLPMLFMGEEYAETNPFLYFVSHTDAELCAAVSKGRKEEFAAFHLEGEAPDPVSPETFMQSKLQWNLPDMGKHKRMLAYYKALISLRKSLAPLSRLNRQNIEVQVNESKKILLLHRWYNEEHVYCFMNFSANMQQHAFTIDHTIEPIFSSADQQWMLDDHSAEFTINIGQLAPESLLICTAKN